MFEGRGEGAKDIELVRDRRQYASRGGGGGVLEERRGGVWGGEKVWGAGWERDSMIQSITLFLLEKERKTS